jgi:hypothetical protein
LHPKFYKHIFLWNVKSTPNYSETLISAGIDTFTLSEVATKFRSFPSPELAETFLKTPLHKLRP